jgi:polyphosphate kinase
MTWPDVAPYREHPGAHRSRSEDDPDCRSVVPPGVWVDDSDEDDPVLRNADGSLVDTWREGYPYAERLSREEYDHEKRLLQVELLKLQYWMQDSGRRLVVICEGRDAAGKGSTIKRFMEHLNPRAARVVALDIPTERERGHWYFQRYISHLPTPNPHARVALDCGQEQR